MNALATVLSDEVAVRQYLAAIIGPTRAPFGQRSQANLAVGASHEIARNTTRDRVLHVTVGRAALAVNAAAGATVIFSQGDQASTNDFEAVFAAVNTFRFTLRPGESLTMLLTTAAVATINFSFGVDTF